jgi:hypothetical protein
MNEFNDVVLFEDQVVHVNLELGPYELVKGYRGEFGLPAEAFTKLYAVAEGEIAVEISGPAALSGVVEAVVTLAQALAFVDLFTARTTHFLFPEYMNAIELVVVRASQRLVPGTISRSTFADWGLEPAEARETADGFVITRNLLVRDRDGVDVRRVAEEVGRDGAHAVRASESVRHVQASDVIFPTYE